MPAYIILLTLCVYLVFRVDILQAGRTGAIKINIMSRNFSVKIPGGSFIHKVDILHLQISNTATGIADKMIVWGDVTVKMLCGIAIGQLFNTAQFRKQSKIPVHCAKTYIRKILSYIVIDIVRSRMRLVSDNIIKDSIALFASVQCPCSMIHIATPFKYIIITIIDFTIIL